MIRREPVEFTCEGCAMRVITFGLEDLPRHQLCAICLWLNEREAPDRLMESRRVCEPGGWQSERQLRRSGFRYEP